MQTKELCIYIYLVISLSSGMSDMFGGMILINVCLKWACYILFSSKCIVYMNWFSFNKQLKIYSTIVFYLVMRYST